MSHLFFACRGSWPALLVIVPWFFSLVRVLLCMASFAIPVSAPSLINSVRLGLYLVLASISFRPRTKVTEYAWDFILLVAGLTCHPGRYDVICPAGARRGSGVNSYM